MPDDLYWDDIVTWSAQQSERLRRLRAGERVNDLDWDNVIEEIETLGRSEIQAVESLLLQAILHLMKRRGWPDSPDALKWRNDAAMSLAQAQTLFRPSMTQRLDLDAIRDEAARRFRALQYGSEPQPMPPLGPVPHQVLVNRDVTLEDLDTALFPPR
jgi:hypothetical protein